MSGRGSGKGRRRGGAGAAAGRSGGRGHGRGGQPRGRAGSPGEQRGRGRRPDDLGGDVVEGRHAVRELLLVGRRPVRRVLVADDVDDSPLIAEILDLAAEGRVPVERVTRRALDAAAHTEAPQGVVATAASIRPVELEALVSSTRTGAPPFLVALDGITDPGNLGAILRTAEVAGVTGVVLPRHRAARLTPAAVKAAAGAVEHLDVALVGGLPAALARLAELDVWSIGLEMGAPTSVFDLVAADGAVALVFGAEGEGLSRLVRERCDLLASIPQLGALGSLNVAAAAAVACYEVVRRRS